MGIYFICIYLYPAVLPRWDSRWLNWMKIPLLDYFCQENVILLIFMDLSAGVSPALSPSELPFGREATSLH